MHLSEMMVKHVNYGTNVAGYVDFDGFDFVYIRIGQRLLGGQIHSRVVDLANLKATNPGRGAFGNLIQYLQSNYPDYIIYAENVLTYRFIRGLKRMGFKETCTPMCLYLPT